MNPDHGERASLAHRTVAAACLSAALFTPGCYHFHVYQIGGPERREQGNQPATEWQGSTLHGFLWGLIRHDLPVDNCTLADGQRAGIEEIRVDTNLLYVLGSALTLGIWVPVEVSWRCAKPPVRTGTLR
jgi:hypothetical protein